MLANIVRQKFARNVDFSLFLAPFISFGLEHGQFLFSVFVLRF